MREAIAALVCAVFGGLLACLLNGPSAGNAADVFAKLGSVLRNLSLSGPVGNVVAWITYLVLCFLPLRGLLPLRRKRGWADVLLAASFVYSLWFWRMLANPTRLAPQMLSGFEGIYAMMAASVLASILLGGILLRLLAERETRQMVRVAERIVTLFAAISGFGAGISVQAIIASRASGLELAHMLFLLACSLLQTATLVWMLGGASDLLSSVQWGWFDAVNVRLSDTLARRSRTLLLVTVLTSIAANAASLLVAGQVQSSKVNLSLPLMELIAAICCMLLARFIREGVRIQTENDSFV